MNTQRIRLDLSKLPGNMQMVQIGQGDSGGTTIVASIYDGGAAADLSGMTARFCMRLPHDSGHVRDASCTISGNTVTYVVDESKCAVSAGTTDEAYFEIVGGNGTIYSTTRFRVMVMRGCV